MKHTLEGSTKTSTWRWHLTRMGSHSFGCGIQFTSMISIQFQVYNIQNKWVRESRTVKMVLFAITLSVSLGIFAFCFQKEGIQLLVSRSRILQESTKIDKKKKSKNHSCHLIVCTSCFKRGEEELLYWPNIQREADLLLLNRTGKKTFGIYVMQVILWDVSCYSPT